MMDISNVGSGGSAGPGKAWVLLGDLKIGADLRIPLIDSIIPAGAGLGMESITVGYNSINLSDDAVSKVRELIGHPLPAGYTPRKGLLVVAAVRVGSQIHPLVLAPAPRNPLPASGGGADSPAPVPSGPGSAGVRQRELLL
ncbi:hypothetical protein, partial [Streptomyces sp. NPDC059003]|uniref:hypothetical protein n=1 Tax=Streptomyces sp. NPDC059003 TaxID=3346691 RepID=UPI00369E6DD7